MLNSRTKNFPCLIVLLKRTKAPIKHKILIVCDCVLFLSHTCKHRQCVTTFGLQSWQGTCADLSPVRTRGRSTLQRLGRQKRHRSAVSTSAAGARHSSPAQSSAIRNANRHFVCAVLLLTCHRHQHRRLFVHKAIVGKNKRVQKQWTKSKTKDTTSSNICLCIENWLKTCC